jgi:Ribbon-helix-helix protein, copG family
MEAVQKRRRGHPALSANGGAGIRLSGVRLPVELVASIRACAAASGLSVSAWVRRALETAARE